MPMPAVSACLRTVLTSHCSASLRGLRITCTPMAILAIHFEISSEMKEPPKPRIAENTSSAPRFRPCCVR